MHKTVFPALLFMIGAFLAVIIPASVQAKPDVAKHESLGTLSDEKGGMPVNTYNGMDRATLHSMIMAIDTTIDSTRREMARRLLLSKAVPPKWTNAGLKATQEKNEKEGGYSTDFLALRLQRLIELGLFEDALALYQKRQNNILPNDVHRLGIMSALFLGKTDLACVEYRAIKNSKKADGYLEKWPAMDALCAHAAGNQPETKPIQSSIIKSWIKNLRLKTPAKYDSIAFDTLSLEEKAFLLALHPGGIRTSNNQDPIVLRYVLANPQHTPAFPKRYLTALARGIPVPNLNEVDKKHLNNNKTLISLQAYQSKKSSKAQRNQAFDIIFSKRYKLPTEIFTKLFTTRHYQEYEPSFSDNARFDYALLSAMHNYAAKNLDTKKTSPEWPIKRITNEKTLNSDTYQTWLKQHCSAQGNVFSKKYCLLQTLMLHRSLTVSDKQRHIKEIYENNFSLTKNFSYVIPIYAVTNLYPKMPLKEHIGSNILFLLNLERFTPSLWDPERFTAILPLFDSSFSDDISTRLVLEALWLWKNETEEERQN